MRYTWIDEYLLGKKGVTKDIQREWNWIRYQIGGKMFVAVCLGEDDKPYYITLKLEPSEGDFLRQQYEDIVPGYYMNKDHWNSIKPDGEVPDDLLKDLLDKSYQLVLEGFSKKKQREILEGDTAKEQELFEASQHSRRKVEPMSPNNNLSADKKAFDYKKEYKEFYMPPNKPGIVEVPPMNYIAVRGKGDPNKEGSEYKESIGLLYAIAFTIKMSKKGNHQIDGYFDYVVPPLEGFWWQDNAGEDDVHNDGGEGKCYEDLDYTRKEDFQFISVIRLPDFVTGEDFRWAIETATEKKKQDFSKVEFFTYEEGLCVQCMHIGPYDDEPETIQRMHDFMEEQGYQLDITEERFHHEIYLSDARRVAPERLKTVVRHPVRKK